MGCADKARPLFVFIDFNRWHVPPSAKLLTEVRAILAKPAHHLAHLLFRIDLRVVRVEGTFFTEQAHSCTGLCATSMLGREVPAWGRWFDSGRLGVKADCFGEQRSQQVDVLDRPVRRRPGVEREVDDGIAVAHEPQAFRGV